MKMKPRHYQQLAEWINDKIDSQKPDLFKRAYQNHGLPLRQYIWDLVQAINQSQWIKDALYSYLDDSHIEVAVHQIIEEHHANI